MAFCIKNRGFKDILYTVHNVIKSLILSFFFHSLEDRYCNTLAGPPSIGSAWMGTHARFGILEGVRNEPYSSFSLFSLLFFLQYLEFTTV